MSDASQSEFTRMLVTLRDEDVDHRAAADRIFEVAYSELRRLASQLMRRERTNHTLRPTELVNEAYLRLVDVSNVEWESRAHFLGIAARAMRQILVDHARRRARARRQGGWVKITFDPEMFPSPAPDIKIIRLDEVLTDLARMNERMAMVVELRVFGGMKAKEVAHVLGVSPRTVGNDWSVAKMWFSRALSEDAP